MSKKLKKLYLKLNFYNHENQRKYKKIGNLFFNKFIKDKPKIDYVMICSTTNTHLDYYKKLNKINKPIFIETFYT